MKPYKAAVAIASQIRSANERTFIEKVFEEKHRMFQGEAVEGRTKTTSRQIIENIGEGMAAAANILRPIRDVGKDG